MYNWNIYNLTEGGEYTSNMFTKFCKGHGILQQISIPSTPQQNGLAERNNRTLLNLAWSMLSLASFPPSFWEEVVATCYLQNFSEEVVATCYLMSQHVLAIFVGYRDANGYKSYYLFDPTKNSFFYSRIVKFNESALLESIAPTHNLKNNTCEGGEQLEDDATTVCQLRTSPLTYTFFRPRILSWWSRYSVEVKEANNGRTIFNGSRICSCRTCC